MGFKFGWNWPSGPREESLKFFNILSEFRNYLPLGKKLALNLNKLESHLPRDDLCRVWLKLTQWFWRRKIFVKVFSQFRNCLPLEKGVALHLNKLESPPPKDALCQNLLKMVQWFWRRKWKSEKFTTTTTTTPTRDKGQILIRKADLSLLLRWAKNHPPTTSRKIFFKNQLYRLYISIRKIVHHYNMLNIPIKCLHDLYIGVQRK